MGKHVIILGAGASYTSGYPLAADLRILLSSVASLDEYLHRKFQPTSENYPSFAFLRKWFSEQSKSIDLFREGGYGTVDEFSFLAGARYPKEVHQMKQTVGLLLALHNPETQYQLIPSRKTSGYEASDYYPFIQRLFRETDEVRDDIVVLTYNYDPYFDYLLSRAYMRRKEAAGKPVVMAPTELVSGFDERNAKAISEGKGFCFLKLHGTAVLPPQMRNEVESSDTFLSYEEIFWKRDEWLGRKDGRLFSANPSPAMFFPWELLDEDGGYVAQDKFARHEELAPKSLYFQSTKRTLYDLCKAIWERARREIAMAEKISFVGLSMHRFLEPGLRSLFSERAKSISDEIDSSLEVILACPGARYPGAEFRKPAIPNSLAERLIGTLCRVYPKMQKGHSECLRTPIKGKLGAGGVVCYDDFASFIQSEL